jgi:proteasome lid subunit RPN8/RPN11
VRRINSKKAKSKKSSLDSWGVNSKELQCVPFPIHSAVRPSSPPIVMKRSVWNEVRRHGVTNSQVEVCGVLVGRLCADKNGPFIYIENSIAGEHADRQVGQVTFTGETWMHIQTEMDRSYADKRILGWYHTHPGFGIFLSEMDMFIHRNFFNLPWQLAYVYDPHADEDGMFTWKREKVNLSPVMIDEDTPMAAFVLPFKKTNNRPSKMASPNSTQVEGRLYQLEKQLEQMRLCFLALLAFSLIWPVGLKFLFYDKSPVPPPVAPVSSNKESLTTQRVTVSENRIETSFPAGAVGAVPSSSPTENVAASTGLKPVGHSK